jgi:ribosomal protein S14
MVKGGAQKHILLHKSVGFVAVGLCFRADCFYQNSYRMCIKHVGRVFIPSYPCLTTDPPAAMTSTMRFENSLPEFVFAFESSLQRTRFREFASENSLQRTRFRELASENSLQRTRIKEFALENLLQRTHFRELASENLLLRTCFRELTLENLHQRIHFRELASENLLQRTLF